MAPLCALCEENDVREVYEHKNIAMNQEQVNELKNKSTFVYVGNLAFYTTQETLFSFFSQFAPVKNVYIGYNKDKSSRVGFCFVEFYTHDAAAYVDSLRTSSVNGRTCKFDLDRGLYNSPNDPEIDRQRLEGRGKGGFQKRDTFETIEDSERPVPRLNYRNREAPAQSAA